MFHNLIFNTQFQNLPENDKVSREKETYTDVVSSH